jgi:hypothetical protein
MAPGLTQRRLGAHNLRRPEVFASDGVLDLGAVLTGIDPSSISAMVTGLSLLIVALTLYVDRRLAGRL